MKIKQETMDTWAIRGFGGLLKYIEARPDVPISQHSSNVMTSYGPRLLAAIEKFKTPSEVDSQSKTEFSSGDAENDKMGRWMALGLEFILVVIEENWEFLDDTVKKQIQTYLQKTFEKSKSP